MLHGLNDKELYELGIAAYQRIKNKSCGLCQYSVGFENGEIYYPNYSACHAWFYNTWHHGRKAPMLVMSNRYQRGEVTEQSFLFYDYLFNRSVFSDCFLTKYPEEIKTRGINLRLDRPSNLAIAGAICTRVPWEKPTVLSTFLGLCEEGVEEDKAFCLAHAFRLHCGNLTKLNYIGHIGLYSLSLSKSGVRNYLKRTLPSHLRGNVTTYTESLTYSNIITMWNDKNIGSNPKGVLTFKENSAASELERQDPFLIIPRLVRRKKAMSVKEKVDKIFEGALE
jgi:hypothetical protein